MNNSSSILSKANLGIKATKLVRSCLLFWFQTDIPFATGKNHLILAGSAFGREKGLPFWEFFHLLSEKITYQFNVFRPTVQKSSNDMLSKREPLGITCKPTG